MTVVNGTTTAANEPGTNLTAADGALSQRVTVSTTTVREMDSPQMVVGASIALNGVYYSDPEADQEIGTANGDTAALSRIDSGRNAPYYVEGMGWFKTSAVSLVG